QGTLLGRAAGSATLTAQVDQLQASIPVTVTAATLARVDIHPPPVITTWAPSRLGATGTFSDGSTQDVTGLVTWAPSDRTVLRLRGTGPDRGTARGVDGGTVQVLAHPVGGAAVSLPVTVSTSPPTSLALVVPDGGIAVGTRPRAQAYARTAAGATLDVTDL